jgi:hypothetical protein
MTEGLRDCPFWKKNVLCPRADMMGMLNAADAAMKKAWSSGLSR